MAGPTAPTVEVDDAVKKLRPALRADGMTFAWFIRCPATLLVCAKRDVQD
jgi:hypothetical protein